jgi:hypothetical protein
MAEKYALLLSLYLNTLFSYSILLGALFMLYIATYGSESFFRRSDTANRRLFGDDDIQAIESMFSLSFMKLMSVLSRYFCAMNFPTGNTNRLFSSSMIDMLSFIFEEHSEP